MNDIILKVTYTYTINWSCVCVTRLKGERSIQQWCLLSFVNKNKDLRPEKINNTFYEVNFHKPNMSYLLPPTSMQVFITHLD